MTNQTAPTLGNTVRLNEPLLLRPEDVARALQIGRTRVYDLIRDGSIRSVKVGGSRRITIASLDDFVDSLVAADGDEAA